MSLIFVLITVLVLLVQQPTEAAIVRVSPVTVSESEVGVCPQQEKRISTIESISRSILNIIEDLYGTSHYGCGMGEWHRVAYLNMSNPSEQCPPAWREDNTDGLRLCRRLRTSSGSCPGTYYTTGRQYSKVCGRVNGYQIGSTDAFGYLAVGETIDSYYVYGVSVTHGTPRNHVWTFAAGRSEGEFTNQRINCPCSDPTSPNNQHPPSFVGDDYFCESGNPTSTVALRHVYSNDSLWDGQQCEGQCCNNGKSPPWFSVELSNPTTDDIEVRICIPQPNYDDIALQLLEIYIQ